MNGNNNNFLERRIFERFPIQLPVRFIDTYRFQEGEGQTVDISAKGMGLITDKNLSSYTPLELWIDIPEQQPFYMRAEVVWSKPVSEDKWRVGIEFEYADFMNVSRVLRVNQG